MGAAMKKGIGFIAAALALGASQPSLAKDSSKISRPQNVEIISSVGDNMVRVDLRESLPNAFGGADVFGRKRDRGYVFLTYMGIRDGRAVIHRRTVDVVSNETTYNQSERSTISGRATTFGDATTISGTVTHSPEATRTTLPPNTIELLIDASKGGIISVEDRVIEISSADNNIVRFKIRSQSAK
jgi:hypothetical protein